MGGKCGVSQSSAHVSTTCPEHMVPDRNEISNDRRNMGVASKQGSVLD